MRAVLGKEAFHFDRDRFADRPNATLAECRQRDSRYAHASTCETRVRDARYRILALTPRTRHALSRRFPFHGELARHRVHERQRIASAPWRENDAFEALEGGEESRLNLAAKGTLNARNVDTMILNSREGPTRLPAHAISRSSNPSVRTKHGVGTLEEYEITWARTREAERKRRKSRALGRRERPTGEERGRRECASVTRD